MKQSFFLALAYMAFFTSIASDLKIKNVRAVNRDGVAGMPISVIFDLEWSNAWHNDKNHDAVWVFMKFNSQWDNHVKLVPGGHKVLQVRKGSQPNLEISRDSLGFFIYPSANYRGDVNYKIQIQMDTTTQKIQWNKLRGMKVHGIEMVYIPQGSFTLGSPDEEAITRAAFYKSDDLGKPDGLYKINSEASIAVGPEHGNLYYWSEEALYNGDQQGPVPAAFPKGYHAFYLMKYELSQGQYANFLNDIPDNWTYSRSPIGGRNYEKKRGGIYFKDGKYYAKSPDRPMNYVSFTDRLAFTDWAALRPVTELEYEKAARGTGTPTAAEFVWGTNNYDQLERYVSPQAEVIFSNGIQERDLDDNNRPVFGASYYWVMDLSGSVWEKVITIGNPIGRNFQGTHGDGKLEFGKATNADWPQSDDEEGGFGYRGGGYYESGTAYTDFNPHSPIGYRYYGAWSGGPRYISYGYRAGRSAE